MEVLVFRQPDPEVANALKEALARGSEALALCALPPGKDSATIRVFWDGQIQPQFSQTPLLIVHESEAPVGDLLPDFDVEWRKRHVGRDIQFTLLSDAAQSWGSLRLPLLIRHLRHHLKVTLYGKA